MKDRGQFQYELDKIYDDVNQGRVPILQIITHGSINNGLVLNNAYMGWDRLLPFLRKINIRTSNNLIVLSSVCFSLQLALETSIVFPAPFYILIAPDFILRFKDFADQTLSFIKLLFEERDAVLAYYCSLQASSEMYHCQEVLFQGLAGYVANSVLDEAGDARIENLIQQTRWRHGHSVSPAKLRTLAVSLNNLEGLLKRYVDGYLIGRPAGFTAAQLESFVQRKKLSNQSSATN